MNKEKKLQELKNLIKNHNYKYYVENNPEISDFEYDNLMAEYQKLKKELNSMGYTL